MPTESRWALPTLQLLNLFFKTYSNRIPYHPPDHRPESQDYHFMINLELRSCRRGNRVTDEKAIINTPNPRE
jgi:hypothetical protein